jgi:Lon protease-like protein
MDDDLDLGHFANRCRLFPLPEVVLFPHAVLPLHIFEPRYRQMTEDALAGDRLVTIVQLRGPTLGTTDALGSPPVEAVGCLGRILQHERLPHGRFNVLLLGRKRVRLVREVPTDRLYRTSDVEVLDDDYGGEPEGPRRDELIRLFRAVFEKQRRLHPDLAARLENALSLGVLTDIIAHALGLPPALKQHLLAEPRVHHRADTLITVLRPLARAGADPRAFPPPFSAN